MDCLVHIFIQEAHVVAQRIFENNKNQHQRTFTIVFSFLASTMEDDLKNVSLLRTIGKEVILARIVEHERSFSIMPKLSTAIGDFGTGTRFKIRHILSRSFFARSANPIPEMEFEYWIENASAPNDIKLTPFEQEMESLKLFREPLRPVGFFERAPEFKSIRILYHIELVKSVGFEHDNLSLHYELSLDPSWTILSTSGGVIVGKEIRGNALSATDRRQALSSVTQISSAMYAAY